MMSDNSEVEFHNAMVEIYHIALEHGYPANRFLGMISEHGGLGAAKRLLASPEAQSGLDELWDRGLLHISMEALILNEHWQNFFTDDELEEARRRLTDRDYSP